MDSVTRVTSLMEVLLKDAGELGVREIAQRAGIPKSSAQRFLETLKDNGWLVQSPQTQSYRVALRFLSFASAWRLKQELIVQSQAVMSDLCARSQQTVLLLVLDGTCGICINKVEPERTIKLVADIGKTFALHAAACGKILLAYSPENLQSQICSSPLTSYTHKTIVTSEALAQEIESIRTSGRAFSMEEMTLGAAEIAVPILDIDGSLIAGISIAGPIFEVEPRLKEFESMLQEASHMIMGNHRPKSVSK